MSEAISAIEDIVAPSLVGMWVHDPIDPPGTIRGYLHHESRDMTVDVKPTEVELVGRVNPIVEYGEVTLVGLSLTLLVPFGDDHDDARDWWVAALEARRAICYRDNRARLIYGAIVSDVGINDARHGTLVAFSLRRVDYSVA